MRRSLAIVLAVMMVLALAAGCTKTPAAPADPADPATPADPAPTSGMSGAEGSGDAVLGGDNTEDESKYGGTLKLNFNAPTNSLDPAQFYTNQNYTPGYHIFEGPVQLDEAGGIWPCVCEYELAEDGLKITFTVREGVKFHNGDTVDANDVEASIARSLLWSDKLKANFGDHIANTEVSGSSVIYTLKDRAPLALMSIGEMPSGCKIMPKEIVDKMGAEGLITEDADVIGTGPYKLGTWVRDVSLEIVRFDDYVPYESGGTGPAAPKMAYFDSIFMTVASDSMTRTTGMLAGEFDYSTGVVSDMQAQLEEAGCWVDINWNGWSPTVMFNLSENNKDSIVQNVNFRKAVLACMDMLALRGGFGRPDEFYRVDSCIVPVSSVYHNDILPHDNNNFDLELAKQYLADSGYNGETVTWICAESDSYYRLSLPASQMLQSIGVNVDLQVHEVATYEQEYVDPTADFDICARENQKPIFNPMLSDRYVSGNVTGWWESEARTAALEKLATTESGSPESVAAFEEFCQAVADEVPYIIAVEFGTPCFYSAHTVPDRQGINVYWWNSYFNDN